MEVACGEYGESVPKLVMETKNGKNHSFRHYIPDVLTIVNGKNGLISNDIMKPNGSPIKMTQKQGTQKLADSMTTTSSDCILKPAASPSSLVAKDLQHGNEDIVINIPNGDDVTKPDKKKTDTVNGPTCTTSLLDSNESVMITLPNKSGFPTSGLAQFWILLKRAFLTIMRDQQLTQMRLVSHIVVGAIIGMIYYDIGNDASKVMSNAGCIFFTTLFTMFTAMMPTILTCKSYYIVKII